MPPSRWTGRKSLRALQQELREEARDRARRLLAARRSSRAKRTFKSLRDTLTGIAVTLLVLGGLYAASGGAWPPALVIESGSMMHPASKTPYGRIGTIDVGDVLFVRSVDPADIRTWAEAGPERYGRAGDVIAFARDGNRENVTVVHRAIARVDVLREETTVRYLVHWVDGEVLEFGREGIYLPALGFSEAQGFTRASGYKPAYSGFITKGDNPGSNAIADQAAGLSGIVDPTWIEGRVYGEIPWLGLAKLIFQFGQTNPEVEAWDRVGNGFAPTELWTCFFVVVAVLLLVPLTWDTIRLWRKHRARRREEARWDAIIAQRAEERRRRLAEERARRGPVEFQPISR